MAFPDPSRSFRSMKMWPAARMASAKMGILPSSFLATKRTDAGTLASIAKMSKMDW